MMNNGHMAWMGTWWFLFWILVIAVPVLLVAWLGNRRNFFNKQESALDVLKKRYAAGEIDRETFERMRKDIE